MRQSHYGLSARNAIYGVSLGLQDETKIHQENTLTGPQLKIHCHGTLVQTSRRPTSEIPAFLTAQSIHSIVSGSH